jgi:BlaI family transcriptional regulator, penicillinase repressor
MADQSTSNLSRRERQILDIVYARGEATAAQVVQDMPDAPTKTAVRTLMRILEEKGHLLHRHEGQSYVYRPSQARAQAGLSALRRVLRTFFDGSIPDALAAHLADDEAVLKPKDLEKMAALIRKARKEGR